MLRSMPDFKLLVRLRRANGFLMKRKLWSLVLLITGSLALLAAQGRGSRQVEWLYYGGDPANTK